MLSLQRRNEALRRLRVALMIIWIHMGLYDILPRCHRCRGWLGNTTISRLDEWKDPYKSSKNAYFVFRVMNLGLPAGWAWPHSGSQGSQCQVGTLLAARGPHIGWIKSSMSVYVYFVCMILYKYNIYIYIILFNYIYIYIYITYIYIHIHMIIQYYWLLVCIYIYTHDYIILYIDNPRTSRVVPCFVCGT